MRKVFLLVALAIAFVSGPVFAAGKTYNVCWSHYTGWEPWAYTDEKGILKKWGDKYGIDIRLTLVNDYVESINQYTAGKYQACTMTNMDALTIPAVGGVDSTALIVGDFSNGNDGILIKGGRTIRDLRQRKIKLVQHSVSHYLLSRALAINGMRETDLTLVNATESDIEKSFAADKNAAAVTWNPILLKLRRDENTNLVFDSSKIPGEIIDLMVVRTDAPETLKKALVGAWCEVMNIMSTQDQLAQDAIQFMATTAGDSLPQFKAQLKTTSLFYKPLHAAIFTRSQVLKGTMEYVRSFSFEHGLYGDSAKTKDQVGIAFADGTVMGNPKNVKLRFDATFMQMAADGKL